MGINSLFFYKYAVKKQLVCLYSRFEDNILAKDVIYYLFRHFFSIKIMTEGINKKTTLAIFKSNTTFILQRRNTVHKKNAYTKSISNKKTLSLLKNVMLF